MKKTLQYLQAFVREDFNVIFYTYVSALLGLYVYLNYQYQLGFHWVNDRNSWTDVVKLFSFYAFAYYMVAIPKAFVYSADYIRQKQFWVKSAFFLLLISIDGSFYAHWNLVYTCGSWNLDEQYFLYKLLTNIYPSLVYFPALWALYQYNGKTPAHFYGITTKGVDFKLYIFFFLFMIPLISWASFQADFLETYPEFKPWRVTEVFGLSRGVMSVIFEFFYLFDFTNVELIFRGALIIGLSHIMGKHTVLPMVVAYAFLHFGKPLGETMGSIFGGYILGVIALQTRSILGGIAIHMGVAFLMEGAAILQHYLHD